MKRFIENYLLALQAVGFTVGLLLLSVLILIGLASYPVITILSFIFILPAIMAIF